MGGLPFHRYGAETAWPVRSSTGYRTRAGWLLASATIYLGWLFGTGGRLLCGQEAGADLVVIHAVIRTQSPDKPVAEALAVRGNRVAEVGSNESIRTWIKPRTHVIDARGRLVVPGFNDSHVHFLAGGQQLSSVDLRTARTTDELAARLRTFAATWPKGRWITGGDWDHENWPGAPLPTRQMIDAASPDHPVFVSRLDGHMALANSVALQRGQVTRDTPDPPGGVIVRDPATGEPTGVLKDAAMQLVSSRIPPLSFDEKLQAAQAATEHAARLGVTSVQDMSGGTDILVYRELHRRQKLRTRVYAMLPLARWDEAQGRGLRAASGDAWLREGGLKGFADGSLGSTTALFFEPYLDAPATRGIPSDEMIPEEKMWQRMVAADHAGLQLMIHASGDRANDQILAVYERLSREEPS
ncbi:MAG: amidohydrolase, partial [Pirellulaceae bacterium]